jgi:DNA polymerase III subunit gamma/tau
MELYKKYRPKNLSEFFGNENSISSLKSYLKSKDQFPSAVLFQGPAGCGKTTLARIVNSELGCSDDGFAELNIANTRGIDTIRQIIESTQYTTFDGGIRVFLLDEVHKLTNDAQNALLKILEDTPQKTYFILCTTDPGKVIKTVKSRCTIFNVNTLPVLATVSLLERVCKLEKKLLSKDILKDIARVSEGSPRSALVILDQVIDLDPKIGLELVHGLTSSEVEAIEICKVLIKSVPNRWSEVGKMIGNLVSEPENARAQIAGYLASVLVNGGEERIGKMLELFSLPFINSGRAGLILALWKACSL